MGSVECLGREQSDMQKEKSVMQEEQSDIQKEKSVMQEEEIDWQKIAQTNAI